MDRRAVGAIVKKDETEDEDDVEATDGTDDESSVNGVKDEVSAEAVEQNRR
jgi:hypothetical protein